MGPGFLMSADHSLSTADLLARAQRGDAEALDRLFQVCRGYLATIAQAQVQARLRAKVDASDLVQQTLLEAYRDFGRFQGTTKGEWLAWLRRVLAHNAADFARRYHGTDKRQAGREVALEALFPSSAGGAAGLPAGGETPSQVLVHRERELQIADALARLPEEYRQVILLRNVQRLPFEEVARQLGRSRPAAQMLWMRALKKLQAVMPDEP
jgi:RNA polymerase sigma-70 factor (ECF subfamily)